MDESRLAEVWKTLHRDEQAQARAEQTSPSWLDSEFGGVSSLLSGSFHQDWSLEPESADEVLTAAVGGASKEQLQMAIQQLPRLIELVGFARNEVELTSLFLALGIDYNPQADGWSTKEWLQHVLDCTLHEVRARP